MHYGAFIFASCVLLTTYPCEFNGTDDADFTSVWWKNVFKIFLFSACKFASSPELSTSCTHRKFWALVLSAAGLVPPPDGAVVAHGDHYVAVPT